MQIPIPPSTEGIVDFLAYTRHPGRLTLVKEPITGIFPGA